MQLHQLPAISHKRHKRVGRGWGSGKGKYAGRGNKGQKSREKVKFMFEGGQAKLSQHLPMLRGKGKNKPIGPKPKIINLSDLENRKLIKTNTVIDRALLAKIGIIEAKQEVKLLGKGKLTKSLIIKIKASERAIEAIKAAGGEYQF